MIKYIKISFLIIVTAVTLLLVLNFTYTPDITGSAKQAPSHSGWDALLKKYISEEGWVDYKGIKSDEKKLDQYLNLLSQTTPSADWSEKEKLAYWINAYNAFTVKLIVDNYPLTSIRDLHPSAYIPLVHTVWHKKFFKLNGRPTNLDEIEHKILRKQFNEPRIHFAINCASVSCPVLRAEAYIAEKLEIQLTDQARKFVNSEIRNKISSDHVHLSRIFQWFKGDFTKRKSLIEFLNQYSEVKIEADAEVDYIKYDWGLNEVGRDER